MKNVKFLEASLKIHNLATMEANAMGVGGFNGDFIGLHYGVGNIILVEILFLLQFTFQRLLFNCTFPNSFMKNTNFLYNFPKSFYTFGNSTLFTKNL